MGTMPSRGKMLSRVNSPNFQGRVGVGVWEDVKVAEDMVRIEP